MFFLLHFLVICPLVVLKDHHEKTIVAGNVWEIQELCCKKQHGRLVPGLADSSTNRERMVPELYGPTLGAQT